MKKPAGRFALRYLFEQLAWRTSTVAACSVLGCGAFCVELRKEIAQNLCSATEI